MATYDAILEIFIERMKDNKLLPMTIRTAKCPSRNSKCRKKHGEIKIESFDRVKHRFVATFYGIHNPVPVFQSEQTEENIRTNIKKAIKKKLYTKKKLMGMMELDISRTSRFEMLFTDYERVILEKRAEKEKTTIADYIRKNLFG